MARLGCMACALVATAGCSQIFGLDGPQRQADAGSPIADADPYQDAIAIPDGPPRWTLRRALAVDGSQVEEALTDFPLLVRWEADAELALYAQDDGDDIRFTDATDTQLAHEIESYDSTTGALIAWVKLPALPSGADTTLYMYFGHTGAPDQQQPAQVWTASYLGVWHLGEDSGTTVADSASTHVGTRTSASEPAPLPASVIGGGASFGGGPDRIDVGDSTAFDVATVSFETWIRVNVRQEDVIRRIVDLPSAFTHTLVVGYPGAQATMVNTESIMIENTLGTVSRHTPQGSFTPNIWHHLAVARDGQQVWIDGTAFNAMATQVGLAQDNTTVTIGNRQNLANAIDGSLDEVRISAVTRSLAWIRASYASQRPGSTFITVGAVEAAP